MLKQKKIGVRPETYRKYKRIAKESRRSIAETADVLADEFLKRPPVASGVEPQPQPAPGQESAVISQS